MKYIIVILSFICLFGTACSDNNGTEAPVVRPEAQGIWVDNRGSEPITYHWVRYGKLEWICENIRTETAPATYLPDPNNSFYERNTEEETLQYGYLYDFETAKTLETEGWRLPTDEDWKDLERHLGMEAGKADKEEWRGDFVGELLMQDSTGSGLNLQHAGYYITEGGLGVRNRGVDGIYWTSTLDTRTQGYAWTRMVVYNRKEVRRFSMLTKKGLSVRLVRDVQQ